MAFTKTIDDADQYFYPSNHINSYDWRKYDSDTREAAFNQAKREIETILGAALSDPVDGSYIRHDYALYEQALYILENTKRQEIDGQDDVIDMADSDKEKKEAPTRIGVLLAPMAKRYLGLNMIKIIRG